MTSLSQYESRLDEQLEHLRIDDGAVVCDLGDPFRVRLNELTDEYAVVQHARKLKDCFKSYAMRPAEIVRKFVTLANHHNGLHLQVDEVVRDVMVCDKRGEQ